MNPVDWKVLFTAVAGTCLVAFGALLIRAIRALDRLILLIDSEKPPGILARLSKIEVEITDLREWALGKGYNRRHEDSSRND